MKISGVMPLRNAVKLGYPFRVAIRSLRPLCDEVVVLVDPTSEDDTLEQVRALGVDRIVESVWDMNNHQGHTNCEISVQTQKVCEAASGDWIMSLQADEVLHEDSAAELRAHIARAEGSSVTGIEMSRLYFYGSLEQYRVDWTLWLLRLFKRGLWKPDVDGAMRFDPIDRSHLSMRVPNDLFHYSRVGNARQIADRVRNLDSFFHAPEKIATGDLPPYDFDTLRKLDTYVVGTSPEVDPGAQLAPYRLEEHPRAALEYFNALEG